MVLPTDGRTPGLVATAAGSTLSLSLPMPAAPGRFLSIGFEKSWAHHGSATIACVGSCVCAPQDFDVHGSKKYTFVQRSKPKWVTPAPTLPSSSGACEVVVRATRLTAGRTMIKAITMSPPRSGNRTINTNSLYSLP